MPEVAYRDNPDTTQHMGTFDIIKGMDTGIREISNELYILRRESMRRFDALEQAQEKHYKDIAELKQDNAVLKNNVAELKEDIKELRRNISDMNGDIKAIAAGFGAAQSRFNWGLVIIGIIVALIQMLK